MFHWMRLIWGGMNHFILMKLCRCLGLSSNKVHSKAEREVCGNQRSVMCRMGSHLSHPSCCSFLLIIARFHTVDVYNLVRAITSREHSVFRFPSHLTTISFHSPFRQNNSTIVAKTRNSITVQIDFEDESISRQLDNFYFKPETTMQNEFGDYMEEGRTESDRLRPPVIFRHLDSGHHFKINGLKFPGRRYDVRFFFGTSLPNQ